MSLSAVAMPDWVLNETPESLGVKLREAVEHGDYALAESLLLYGAEVNLPTEQSRSTALHVAAWKPNERLVSLLLRHNADPNFHAHVDNRSTPTHFVAQCGSTFSLGQMIEHGAKLDVPNRLGDTPMHCAAYIGLNRIPNIVALLDAGADPSIPNAQGKDVLAVAEDKGHGDVVGAVLAHYAELPVLAEGAAITRRALFATNEKGFCPLDNPKTWHDFSRIQAALEERGEALAKADLMKTGIHDKSWLQRAAECRALPEVLASLAEQGDGIMAEDLLKPNGKSTPLLTSLIETATLPHLMNEDHWLENASKMRKCYDALPEKGKELVPNPHQLFAEVARRDRQLQRGAARW